MLFTPTFWYYAISIMVALLFAWYIVLSTYHSTITPRNSINSIMSLTIWSLALIVFMYGAYTMDPYDTDGSIVTLFRLLFGVLVLSNIMALFLFYWAHDLGYALVAYIYCLILIIGLIFLYTVHDITSAWLVVPYMLVMIYYIYSLLYIYSDYRTRDTMRII